MFVRNFKKIGSFREAVALSTEIFMNFHAQISVDKATASLNEPIDLKFRTEMVNTV